MLLLLFITALEKDTKVVPRLLSLLLRDAICQSQHVCALLHAASIMLGCMPEFELSLRLACLRDFVIVRQRQHSVLNVPILYSWNMEAMQMCG